MIKAIIFDIGEVLINKSSVLDEILKEFNLNEEDIYDYYCEVLRKHEKGEISEEVFWELLKKKFNIRKPIPHPSLFIRRYQKEIKIDKEMLDLALKLKKKGYRIAVLSNTLTAHSNHMHKLGLLKHFPVRLLSHEIHLLKPDPAIYKLALEKLHTKPEETIFIDNIEEYVLAAKSLGIKGILFKNANDLKLSLKKLEIEVD